MKIFSQISKYLFLLLLCLIFANFIAQYQMIIKKINFEKIIPYCISGSVFLIFYFVTLKKVLKFWQIFTHELTHVLFALITFNRIEGFTASHSGGVTSYNGKSNWLIRLCPYFFPIFPFLFIFLSLLISQTYKIYFYHLIGISYVFFQITLFQYFSLKEEDIQKSGYIFSSIVILIFYIFILVFLIFFLQDDLDIFLLIIKKVFSLKHLTDNLSKIF